MRYFKYIFFFLIFNFSIIGDYSNARYNPLNYLRATESVIKRISQQDFNGTYFWRHDSIKKNNLQFFIFSFKNFQIYVDQLFKFRFLIQNKLFDKLDFLKKEILKHKKPRLSTEIFLDLCKMADLKTGTAHVCKKLHAMKNSNSKSQIFQKCINQTKSPIGFFEISKLFSAGSKETFT